MMMTWRRSEGKQEVREGEGIFQQEEAWMTIEQEDTIVHPFVLRQFLHNTASRRISQDGRSQKFHLGEFGHLDFWEQFDEAVDYAREFFRCKANVDYIGLLRVNYEAYPLKPSVHLCTSLRTDSGEPPIVASSRYQTFSSESTPLAI